MQPNVRIETFCLGDWMTNCYVVAVGEVCWIVDAGFEPEPLIQFVRDHALTPQQVVLTHAHVDHIAGLHDIRRAWPDIPILIHPAETEFLTDAMLNLSALIAMPVMAPDATGTIEPDQSQALNGVTFQVRHTPGHSPGGITLYQAETGVAIVGDALFAGSIGRTDFPTSDHNALINSIRTQLLSLPDNTRVLPGHGPETTIGAERHSNPFL